MTCVKGFIVGLLWEVLYREVLQELVDFVSKERYYLSNSKINSA